MRNPRKEQILRLYPHFIATANTILHATPDAEDAVQNALLYVMSLSDDKETTDGWLLQLVRNRAITVLRGRGVAEERDAGFLDETHAGYDGEQLILLRDLERVLYSAMSALPDNLRDATYWAYCIGDGQERSSREVAEIMAKSKSAVCSYLNEARSILANKLEDWKNVKRY